MYNLIYSFTITVQIVFITKTLNYKKLTYFYESRRRYPQVQIIVKHKGSALKSLLFSANNEQVDFEKHCILRRMMIDRLR